MKWRLEIWMSRCRWAEFKSYGRPRSWLSLCWEDTLLTNVNIEQELSWHLEGRCDCLHRCYKMIDMDKKRKVKRWEITESGSTVAKTSMCVKFHSFLNSFVVKSRLIIVICQLLTNICLKISAFSLYWEQPQSPHAACVKSMWTLESLNSERSGIST